MDDIKIDTTSVPGNPGVPEKPTAIGPITHRFGTKGLLALQQILYEWWRQPCFHPRTWSDFKWASDQNRGVWQAPPKISLDSTQPFKPKVSKECPKMIWAGVKFVENGGPFGKHARAGAHKLTQELQNMGHCPKLERGKETVHHLAPHPLGEVM